MSALKVALDALAEAAGIDPLELDSVLYWAEHDRVEFTADGVLHVFPHASEDEPGV